jgi:hypothetical protein
MTPYLGICLNCGQDIGFESPPEQWHTLAGDQMRAMTPAARLDAMRSMFAHMTCPLCGGALRLHETDGRPPQRS